ncbi:2'-5' RNA ligase family protein [Alicyclobacillus acidoterrestris]|uniref:2'-5' RNA ligase family protein n=1 Tax=Alicyclobacillus acidoterrestris (strain ATCC 49025 / DSM 3922 / CIP 106132 / NCIMB 13137 / GD3B) TaxID=1356854 RepID=T0CIH3_ALIAG|nr:2'-5' RNA ligase family protein [Alicyclobacillus acidoterrestris]EPZ52569.1 hypothetical protein N007_20475 [Alicyclobacillus acidoterrestris ATCC 49025]UNO47278.1 2'-5' RNA ligase family protein [Alicyclobacillus acidoterrestris]
MQRAIHIFPNFENVRRIEDLRKQYDPLYGLIAPHMTLVFPFDSDISSVALEDHVRVCVSGIPSFPLVLREVTGAKGGYLFLNVKRGNDWIVRLHDVLYSGPLRQFLNRQFTYVPHMTVGRIPKLSAWHKAIRATEDFHDEFETVISEICIESISATGAPNIEAVIQL